MKIGIMTYFRPINYGAFLQAYGLSHRLNQENDIEAEIIDFHMPVEDERYTPRIRKNVLRGIFNIRRYNTFRKALSSQLLSKDTCCGGVEDFITFVDKKYDIIIAGSDEIWKVDNFRGFPTPYFLPGDLNCIKVSYAASGRTPFNSLTDSDIALLKTYFNDYDYIGVRDCKTKKDIENIIPNANIHINYDPTFIYDFKPDRERGERLLEKYFHIRGDKKVIAIMYDGTLSAPPNLEHYLKQRYGQDCTFISLYNWCMGLKCYPDVNPLDWIDIVTAVDGMISMYFHGICFSVVSGTPFYAIDKLSPNNEQSKLYDLLNKINSLDRYSLGVDSVIKENKLDNFVQEVMKGQRLDFSWILVQARQEFEGFLNDLRHIYSDSKLSIKRDS